MSNEPDAIKAAEARGYSKGYAAGQRRAEREDRAVEREQRRQEFRERAFLAALPACVTAQNWKAGDKPIASIEARTALAWDFADQAVKRAWFL